MAQMVKNLPTMQETQVQSPSQEYPLETGMATHSSSVAWRIPWTEEPGKLSARGRKELDTTERLTHTPLTMCSLGSPEPIVDIDIYSYFYICMGFPGGSDGKESACNVGNLGLTPE